MKKLIALLLVLAMAMALVACGQPAAPKAEEKTEEKAEATEEKAEATEEKEEATEEKAEEAAPAEGEAITLKVWGPQEDYADDNSFLPVATEKFKEAYPEWSNVEFVFETCAEGDAGTMVTKDPTAAADVYAFASDQLGTLRQANAIAKLGGDALAQVQNANYGDAQEAVILSVSDAEGNIYGVPFTPNTWFMYYDASVYTEEDVKSLDAMMAKKTVAFPVTNTWYMPAFYFANGGTMFGDGTDGTAGITFGGEAGAAATTYVANALANGTLIDDANGAGMDGLRNGTVGAIFSGTWDAKNVSEALGENYRAAALPTITIDGEAKQMYSFNGTKAYAVNPNSANMKLAYALAAWLGSTEMQQLHYEIRNGEVIPCDASLADLYAENPAAVAQADTMAFTSKLQPNITEMGMYWGNAESMGKALANGEVNADNAAELTDTWNTGLNG